MTKLEIMHMYCKHKCASVLGHTQGWLIKNETGN